MNKMKKWKSNQMACVAGAAALLLTGCGTGETGGVAPVGEDRGREPWVIHIEEITVANREFRIARWTGAYLQMTLMSLEPGQEIGLELHDDIDQFIRIEQGRGRVVMGRSRDALTFEREVEDDWAILIPAGYWHNVINTGDTALKLYSIYAPPEHPAGTVHSTAEEAEAAHDHHHH
jgi:mannose-6-phosphate isomerase-like protein (cupin superfamily)